MPTQQRSRQRYPKLESGQAVGQSSTTERRPAWLAAGTGPGSLLPSGIRSEKSACPGNECGMLQGMGSRVARPDRRSCCQVTGESRGQVSMNAGQVACSSYSRASWREAMGPPCDRAARQLQRRTSVGAWHGWICEQMHRAATCALSCAAHK